MGLGGAHGACVDGGGEPGNWPPAQRFQAMAQVSLPLLLAPRPAGLPGGLALAVALTTACTLYAWEALGDPQGRGGLPGKTGRAGERDGGGAHV